LRSIPKIEQERKLDGIFMLRTNADPNKRLWTVEQSFRRAKHLLLTRPIFHKLRREHLAVTCSAASAALALKTELEQRIAGLGRVRSSWPEIVANLDSLTETEIEYDGKRFVVRGVTPPPAWPCVPPASLCRRPCAAPPTDYHLHRRRSAPLP
jgi:hypothetical protein